MPRKPTFDRDDLISRARDVFWAKGWAGTSMKDLEAALAIKPGSFYAAFGSKEALYDLALERYAQEGAARLRAHAEAVGPLEALKQHPARLLERTEAASRACMVAKTFLELQAAAHPLATQAEGHLEDMEALFEELFREAQARGDISSTHDPVRLAQRYQSDLLGFRASADRSGVNAKALAEDMADALDRLGPS